MNKANPISRRAVLRGFGCAVALPWLEAMGPVTDWAMGAPTARPAPNRMAFVYVPNGQNMADWTPKTQGSNFELPTILQPLADVRDDLLILTGLVADQARAHGDGNSGNHARAMAAFLTGSHPHKTQGEDIHAGISVDQVAAARLVSQTRLGSLEIGCEGGTPAGNCDTGYSCAYTSTMSWRSPTTPLPKETNPRLRHRGPEKEAHQNQSVRSTPSCLAAMLAYRSPCAPVRMSQCMETLTRLARTV